MRIKQPKFKEKQYMNKKFLDMGKLVHLSKISNLDDQLLLGAFLEIAERMNDETSKSVWLEKEIVDMLLTWEMVERSGAWYYISQDLKEICSSNNIEIPEKFQGENALFSFIEGNEKLTKILHKHFVDMISSDPSNEIQNA